MNHLNVGIFCNPKNKQKEGLFPKGEIDEANFSSYATFEV